MAKVLRMIPFSSDGDEPTVDEAEAPPSHTRLKRQSWVACLGQSPAIREVLRVLQQVCARVAHGGTPAILLTGETGTGKGFFARHVHENAKRGGPFIEINCAALPPTLMESELFGHERGAFTDAKASRQGLFEAASGGTLFLDEIDALPLDLQAKLLTAIEDKRVRRIGGRTATHVDVQIIAATHEDLESRARAGLFRADLFYRLNVVAVQLPPLRERAGDAVLLAEEFIASLCAEYGLPRRTLADDARAFIAASRWPGNVRELKNRIERIILLEDDDVVRAAHFGARVGRSEPPPPADVRVDPSITEVRLALPPGGISLEDLERTILREALNHCKGNVSYAARYLSISRQTLIYRIKKYNLTGAAQMTA